MSDIDEQATNLASALLAFNNNKEFHSFISKSLNDLRQKKKKSTTEVSVVSVVTKEKEQEKEAAASLLELVQGPKKRKKRKKNTNHDENSNQEVNIDDKDMEAIIKQLRIAEIAGEINKNSSNRLKILQCLINKCQKDGLVTCMTSSSENNMCILGWSQMLVKEPLQFNIKIREMIEQDYNGIWKKANGNKISLRNPTWLVYELFRKIGVKPRSRGDIKEDPGKLDMLYYKEWNFINDESFKLARKRLATGFNYSQVKRIRTSKKNCTEQSSNTP